MLFITALWFLLATATTYVVATDPDGSSYPPPNTPDSLPVNDTIPLVAFDCSKTPAVCATICDWYGQAEREGGYRCDSALSLDSADHHKLKTRDGLDEPERCGDERDYTGSGECKVAFPPRDTHQGKLSVGRQKSKPGAGRRGYSTYPAIARAEAPAHEVKLYRDQLNSLFHRRDNGWNFIAAVAQYDGINQCNAASDNYHHARRKVLIPQDCIQLPTSNNSKGLKKTRASRLKSHIYTLDSGKKVLARGMHGLPPVRSVFLVDETHPDGGRHEAIKQSKALPMPPFIGVSARSDGGDPTNGSSTSTTLEVGAPCTCLPQSSDGGDYGDDGDNQKS